MPAASATGAAAPVAAGAVAVVTDSTASMAAGVAASAGVIVVPLRLLAGDLVADDGAAGAADAIEAAAARCDRLTTARPTPAAFEAAYRTAAGAGARAVVSVHLSGLLSGTVSSAALAAAAAPIPVRVLDARTIGSGLGLVVLAAAAAARQGQSPDAVASAAGACADQVGSFFAVDSPDALLAGGRAAAGQGEHMQGGHGQAAPGDPDVRLVSRTVLRISAGRIATVDRVRTWAAAATLLAESAMEHAASLPAGYAIDVVVEHVAAAPRASALAGQLAAGLARPGRVLVVTAGTAIRVHTGPGMLGVSVAPSPDVG